MKRMTYFVMALALVLGLAQCKKEKLETPQNEGNSVMITLNVKNDNNAKVEVDPPHVTFEKGDQIHVVSNGLHVGTLTYDTISTNPSDFSGFIQNATHGEPLYFYFFGNKSPQFFDESKRSCTVYIGDQTGDLPVISMGASTKPFLPNDTTYSARLHNKCSLMKFNVTADTEAPICINGMNNFVTVKFDRSGDDGFIDGFKYSQVYNGEIKMEMKGQDNGTKTYWAIVLPQAYVDEGSAYTEDYTNIGTRPSIIGGIDINQYYSDGVDMTMESYDPLGTPLTFEAISGATVTLDIAGSSPDAAPDVYLEANIEGRWINYEVGTSITLGEGGMVMFRARRTNDQFGEDIDSYNNFSIDGECYVYGNIMSLIDVDYANLKSFDSEADYIFESLFAGCEGLSDHPQKPLELPATGLATYCYSHMFSGCTGLTVAPKLRASGLREGCYQGMFQGCISLEESPVLSAAMLVQGCYAYMFSDCTSLGRVTCLATSGMGDNTSGWLSNVLGGGTFTKAAGVTWPLNSESGIPSGWTVEQ